MCPQIAKTPAFKAGVFSEQATIICHLRHLKRPSITGVDGQHGCHPLLDKNQQLRIKLGEINDMNASNKMSFSVKRAQIIVISRKP